MRADYGFRVERAAEVEDFPFLDRNEVEWGDFRWMGGVWGDSGATLGATPHRSLGSDDFTREIELIQPEI